MWFWLLEVRQVGYRTKTKFLCYFRKRTGRTRVFLIKLLDWFRRTSQVFRRHPLIMFIAKVQPFDQVPKTAISQFGFEDLFDIPVLVRIFNIWGIIRYAALL